MGRDHVLLGGPSAEPSDFGALAAIELGALRIAAPVTEFSRTQQTDAWDGYLGAAALRRFRIIVNMQARTLTLIQD